MAAESSALPAKGRALNPEWTLAVLALLTFALIPIQINTIYSGLPAHPLLLHVPVILIPVAAIGALVLVAWPRLFVRNGLWLGLVAVVALGATNLTIGAGHALRDDLNLQGPGIVAQHASAADTLRILLIAFTALLLIAVAVFRTAGPRVTGVGPVDGALTAIRSGVALGAALRVIVAVFAIASLYYVFHTGDLGAKAVWQHRFGGGGGFPGGGGTGSLFQGGGAPPGG
ncbi:MAG TPA: hypothetical protein VHW04_03865 [Solirubrobacteraceae bacterium]|nr:hypothetical protein [Solirubrobacteraceae bacterium]